MKNKIFSVLALIVVIASYFSAIDGRPLFGFDFDQVSFFSGAVLFVILLITLPVWLKDDDEKYDYIPFLFFVCVMMFLLFTLVMHINVFKESIIPSGADIMVSGIVGFIATIVAFIAAGFIVEGVDWINNPIPKNNEDDSSSS